MSFRFVTYNVHKCKGLDGLVRPRRIAAVLARLDADVCALQEIFEPQVKEIRAMLPGYESIFGQARILGGVPYGNAILSRFATSCPTLVDLSVPGREPRIAMKASVELEGRSVSVHNVHLGTSARERQVQLRTLIESVSCEGASPCLLAGDFNDWSGYQTQQVLGTRFAHLREHRIRRSYPGLVPLLHLDQVFFDSTKLRLKEHGVVRTRETLVASDHLPLTASLAFNFTELTE